MSITPACSTPRAAAGRSEGSSAEMDAWGDMDDRMGEPMGEDSAPRNRFLRLPAFASPSATPLCRTRFCLPGRGSGRAVLRLSSSPFAAAQNPLLPQKFSAIDSALRPFGRVCFQGQRSSVVEQRFRNWKRPICATLHGFAVMAQTLMIPCLDDRLPLQGFARFYAETHTNRRRGP